MLSRERRTACRAAPPGAGRSRGDALRRQFRGRFRVPARPRRHVQRIHGRTARMPKSGMPNILRPQRSVKFDGW